ncbi:MAG: hypothetical protein ACOC0P_01640 [Planctomycetota bacterium]
MSVECDPPISAVNRTAATDVQPSPSPSGDANDVDAPAPASLLDLASLPDEAWHAEHDEDDAGVDPAMDSTPSTVDRGAHERGASSVESVDGESVAHVGPVTGEANAVNPPRQPLAPETMSAGPLGAEPGRSRPTRSSAGLLLTAFIAVRSFWSQLWIRPASESASRPLLRFDAGWLYLFCGLSLLSATVILPPSDALHIETARRDAYRQHEKAMSDRLEAYNDFKVAIQRQDPELVRRLALTNYRQIPDGATPIAMYPDGLNPSIDAWISATLPPPTPPAEPQLKDSWLRRTATGPHRLWLIGGAFILIAIGLVLTDHRPALPPADEPDDLV